MLFTFFRKFARLPMTALIRQKQRPSFYRASENILKYTQNAVNLKIQLTHAPRLQKSSNDNVIAYIRNKCQSVFKQSLN